MMGILIKDMEMPTMCLTCPFEYRGNCMVSAKDVEEFEYGGVKDTNCPLIEVPTPHGRLIDADDAVIDADERGFDFWCCDADIDSAQSFIRAQPTVIEAEGE